MSEEQHEERRWERPRRGRARSFLITLVVLALLGVVLWLLSERNARQWFLVYEDGMLEVKRGVLFPVGRQAFKTDDPALAAAYAPIKPPPGAKVDEDRRFDDRAGLDQALYELLARWAREDVATEKPELVQRALGWIGRADRLAGISSAQREDLRVVRAEVGWFEARQLLEKSADALRQARERLRMAANSPTTHAREADTALRRVDPLVEELHEVIREVAPPGPSASPASVAGAGGAAPTSQGVPGASQGPSAEAQPGASQGPPAAAQPGAPQRSAPEAQPGNPAAQQPPLPAQQPPSSTPTPAEAQRATGK